MAENTHISWADDTFNGWIGCMKVGPACDGCYAEHMMDTRMGRVKFGGPGKGVGTRQRTTEAYWRKPLTWNREQECLEHNSRLIGEVAPARFVFCASLADVFDNAVPAEWRRDLFDLIRKTPHLTWLLLTKRPQNIAKLFAETLTGISDGDVSQLGRSRWPKNAAIGCTVVTQAEADRDVPHLLRATALNPAFAFLSMEPLLGEVDLTNIPATGGGHFDALRGLISARHGMVPFPKIDWIITGGETDQGAHNARPSHPDWFRSLRDQCAAAGVPYHHKQNGEWAPGELCPNLRARDAASLFDGAWHFERVPASRGDEHIDDEPDVYRVGKKAAGRLLDGVVHDARPAVR